MNNKLYGYRYREPGVEAPLNFLQVDGPKPGNTKKFIAEIITQIFQKPLINKENTLIHSQDPYSELGYIPCFGRSGKGGYRALKLKLQMVQEGGASLQTFGKRTSKPSTRFARLLYVHATAEADVITHLCCLKSQRELYSGLMRMSAAVVGRFLTCASLCHPIHPLNPTPRGHIRRKSQS